MTEEPWSWPDVARELRPMVEQLTPQQALSIIRRLFEVEKENYVAPMLAGLVRGSVERRDDEAKRRTIRDTKRT